MKHLTTVIPVYNGERYEAQTLDSVARQRRRPDRLVVLDNCSTDGTRDVVSNFSGMPCELRKNETNLGLFGTLNRALDFAAEPEWLHRLHADDIIKPDYYERSLAHLASVPGRAMIYCQAE